MMNEIIRLGTIHNQSKSVVLKAMIDLAHASNHQIELVCPEDMNWRTPSNVWSVKKAPSTDVQFYWHRDELGYDIKWMGIWSNKCPTQIQLFNEEIFQPEDGEFVLINNDLVTHRCPVELMSESVKSTRYFARIEAKVY